MNKTVNPVKWPAIIIIVLALVLMFAGFKNGEHKSYFQKAILICTQCIGLG
ncbi:MAG: CD1871A family CXXC motif-containing protein [Candidatus Rifleibacteriota bacterium]